MVVVADCQLEIRSAFQADLVVAALEMAFLEVQAIRPSHSLHKAMTEALVLLPHLRKSSAQAAVVVAPMPRDQSEFLIAMVATVAQARQAASVDQASPTQVAVVADTAMHPAQPHIPEELAEVVAVALALEMDLMPFQAQQILVAVVADTQAKQVSTEHPVLADLES